MTKRTYRKYFTIEHLQGTSTFKVYFEGTLVKCVNTLKEAKAYVDKLYDMMVTSSSEFDD